MEKRGCVGFPPTFRRLRSRDKYCVGQTEPSVLPLCKLVPVSGLITGAVPEQ